MPAWKIFSRWLAPKPPAHLRAGRLGERAAKRYLRRQGLKFLVANFQSKRGEIDLIFRDGDCLVFVEVKTRSSEEWTRPSQAVDRTKQRALRGAAFDYLNLLGRPTVSIRFDVVEVLLAGNRIREIRHLADQFGLPHPYRYQ